MPMVMSMESEGEVIHAQFPSWILLGALLLRENLVTSEQLEEALLEQQRVKRRLGEILVEQGIVTSRQIAQALAAQYRLDFVDLADVMPEPNAVKRVPEAMARRYGVLPLRILDDGSLQVALADPTAVTSAAFVGVLGLDVEFAVADAGALEFALDLVYSSAENRRSA
jgi:type IV pilus assembly protein PilB